MRDICSLLWCALVGLFRSRTSLEAEILLLRHHDGVKACQGAGDDKAHEKEESLRQAVDSKGSLQEATTNQAGRSPSIALAIS
jgi:hypothetical protein